jgi:adenine/guanine/hypoxanthine permease
MSVSTTAPAPAQISQRWWTLTRGDVDATVAQVGFNLAQLVIPVFLLLPVGIPIAFSVTHLVPGYALGFLVGSLGLVKLAANLARREGRKNVTAHVYGNNVPAIIAYTLTIMLPVYLQTRDANRAWEIGAAAVAWTGIIKLAAVPFAGAFRRFIPVPAAMTVFGAAMYSYLALVLLQRVFDQPLVGLIALGIILPTVLANIPITKWRIPPFIVAWIVPLAVGLAVGYVRPAWQGLAPRLPAAMLSEPLQAMLLALPYLSVIAPMAIYHVLQDIASVAGGSAAGDEYDVRGILLCDGLGTLVCGLAGSVVAPVVYALLPPYNVYRPVVSMADSGRDDCVCMCRRRHGNAQAGGPEIHRGRAARLCSAGRRRCGGGGQFRTAGAAAFCRQSGGAGRAEPVHLLVIDSGPGKRIPLPGARSRRRRHRTD